MKLSLSHILVRHAYEAEDAQKQLQQGKDFADLAKRFSTCPSAPQGGSLGLIDTRRLDPDFAEAAEALKPEQTSGVVRTKFGYHLIRRHE